MMILSLIMAGPLFDLALAEAEKAPEACSVTATTHTEADVVRDTVFRYDAQTDKWTLLSLDGEAPDAETLAVNEAAARDPWTNNYLVTAALIRGLETEVLHEDGKAEVFRAGALPPGTVSVEGHDVSAHVMAYFEAVPDEDGAIIHRQRMTAPESFRMQGLARVLSANYSTDYARLPDGRVVPVEVWTQTTVSVFGQKRDFEAVTRYSDYDCD